MRYLSDHTDVVQANLFFFLPVKRQASSRCHHPNTLSGWSGDSLSFAGEVKTNIFFLVPQWVSILCPHQTHCKMFSFKTGCKKLNTLLFSFYHFSITAAWSWIVILKCTSASISRGHTSAARTSSTSKLGFWRAHRTQCPSDLLRRIWVRRPFYPPNCPNRFQLWHDSGVCVKLCQSPRRMSHNGMSTTCERGGRVFLPCQQR